jgi:uncharacterized membrane protein YccF (DUF307 family)
VSSLPPMNLPPPTPQSSPVAVARPVAPGRSGPLRVIGNILWFVLAGLWMALGYLVAGVIQCLTIIGIPFGIQSFKLAGYALWPFGRVVVQRTDRDQALSCLGNAVWFVLSGLWLALGHLLTGLLLCLTIIGIPFGVASFKLAGLALVPFGKMVVRAGAPVPSDATIYLTV